MRYHINMVPSRLFVATMLVFISCTIDARQSAATKKKVAMGLNKNYPATPGHGGYVEQRTEQQLIGPEEKAKPKFFGNGYSRSSRHSNPNYFHNGHPWWYNWPKAWFIDPRLQTISLGKYDYEPGVTKPGMIKPLGDFGGAQWTITNATDLPFVLVSDTSEVGVRVKGTQHVSHGESNILTIRSPRGQQVGVFEVPQSPVAIRFDEQGNLKVD
jgi:hypothetical protein